MATKKGSVAGSRKPNGQFAKGVSGNPGGKPRASAEVREAIRRELPDAVKELAAILRRKTSKDRDRIEAARVLLTWGLPKPVDQQQPEALELLTLFLGALSQPPTTTE